MDLDLTEVLSVSLTSRNTRKERNGSIYATDLGVALPKEDRSCPIELWGKLHDEPSRVSTNGTLLMFHVGDLIHDSLVDHFRERLPHFGWEVEAAEERCEWYGCSGRYDMLIKNSDTGERIVVDFKTKRGNAFKGNYLVKQSNVLQVQFYMAALNINRGILLYVDREGSNFGQQVEVGRNDTRVLKAIQAIQRLSLMEFNDIPEEAFCMLTMDIKRNIGDDSIYLRMPWQPKWCSLAKCHCKEQYPPDFKGVVAKVSESGKIKPVIQSAMPYLMKHFGDEIQRYVEQTYGR